MLCSAFYIDQSSIVLGSAAISDQQNVKVVARLHLFASMSVSNLLTIAIKNCHASIVRLCIMAVFGSFSWTVHDSGSCVFSKIYSRRVIRPSPPMDLSMTSQFSFMKTYIRWKAYYSFCLRCFDFCIAALGTFPSIDPLFIHTSSAVIELEPISAHLLTSISCSL
jgi:hypothetical protein